MVHKRYIVRNGKRYGPYIYKTYRSKDGRVRNTYLGKKRFFINSKLIQKIFFIILVFSLIIFLVRYASGLQSTLVGDTNLTIWDDTDTLTKKSNEMVYFYANYTNDTSQESINLTNTWCNITFNLTGDWEPESNMSFNPTASQYEYNRTFTTKDILLFNVTCSDDTYQFVSVTDNFTITNTLPVISTPLSIESCTEDVICTYNFSADVTDPDSNDILTYGYDAETGIFSGFSINSASGIVTVNVTVEGQTDAMESVKLIVVDTSGDGAVATKNFTINFINDTPIMTIPSNPKECIQDQECSMQVTATDEENDPYSFNTNSTLFLIDSETGWINITLNNSEVGGYWVNISVNDSYGNTASQDVNFTVFNVNDPPVLDYVCNETITTEEDSLFECDINATDSDFISTPNENLTFYVNETWVTLLSNGSNATAYFTANDSEVGSWSINISVMDGSNGIDSRIVNFTILNVSEPPMLVPIGELSAFTGISFHYDVNATDEDLLIPNSEEVLYFSTSGISLFQINSSTGEFSFIASQSDIGIYWVNFTVNDTDDTTSSEVVNITVYNNTAPDFSMETELNYSEDEELYLNLSENASDPDGYDISFSSNSSMFDINLSTGIINVTLNDSFVGENWVNFTVNDSHGLSTSLLVNITVLNLEDLPNFTEPLDNYTAYEDLLFYLQVNGSDEDLFIPSGNVFGIVENLTYSVNETTLFDISSDGIINFTPNDTQAGEYWFNISILDHSSNSYSEVINLTILAVNDAPSFTDIENIATTQGTAVYLDINASDEEDGSDNDTTNTNLTFWINTTQFDPDGDTSIINSTTGIISFTPNSSHVGTHYINVSVNDTGGVSSSYDITMVISPINNAPSIVSCTVSGFTCNAPCDCEQIYVYENSTNTTFTVYTQDLDDDSLTYEWFIEGLLNKSGLGTDTGVNTGSDNSVYSPNFTDYGVRNITVFINDSLNTTVVEWNVSVLNVNSPPTFDVTIQNISWNQDTSYSNLDLDDHFSDVENQTDLLFTWTQYDSSLVEINSTDSKINISVSASHTITLIPTSGWYGQEYVVFTGNDTEDSISSNEVMLNVTRVVSTSTSTSTGGGGGGGASISNLVAIDIIHATELSFVQGEQIISPIKIKNTNSQLTLYDINLSVKSESDFITARLDKTFIKSLAPMQEEYLNLILDSAATGVGEISVIATVANPPFQDSAKFFVNVVPLNLTDMEEKVKFVKDLFKENPECLELNELLSEAEKALNSKNYKEVASMLQLAIDKCKDLITSKEQEQPIQLEERRNMQRLLLLIVLNISLLVMFFIIRRKVIKKREKEEYG